MAWNPDYQFIKIPVGGEQLSIFHARGAINVQGNDEISTSCTVSSLKQKKVCFCPGIILLVVYGECM